MYLARHSNRTLTSRKLRNKNRHSQIIMDFYIFIIIIFSNFRKPYCR